MEEDVSKDKEIEFSFDGIQEEISEIISDLLNFSGKNSEIK